MSKKSLHEARRLLSFPENMRRFFHWLFRIALVLALGTLIWAGIYVHNRGFTKKWRMFVLKEFHKRGVEIFFTRMTLDPFHGLVARNVRIVDNDDHEKILAVIDRVTLDVNFAKFIRGEPFLNAVDLKDAGILLPFDPSDPSGQKFWVTKLNARLLFPPDQIYLSQAEADVFGTHVSASGRLLNPGAYHPSAAPGVPGEKGAAAKGNRSLYTGIARQLSLLQHEGEAPRVEVRFNGDLAAPDKIFADATVWAEKVRCNRLLLGSLYATLEYRDGVCSLKQLVASDARGRMDASGSFQPSTGEFDLALRSGMDPLGIASAARIASPLDGCVFYSMPQIEISARGNAREQARMQVSGQVKLGRFAFRSVGFEGMSAHYFMEGGKWYLDDFKLAHRSGTVTGTAMQIPGDFRCRLASTINPGELRSLLSAKVAEALAELDFEQPPRLELTAHGTTPGFDTCEATGSMLLGKTRIHGSPLNSVTARVVIKDKAVACEQFEVDRDEGKGTGTFIYDFGRNEVRLDHIKTSLIPTAAAAWIDKELLRNVSPYKFKTPPNLSINGVVQINGDKNTNLEILVDAPGGMDYVFLKKTLSTQKISGRLHFTEGRLRLSDVVASLYSGRLMGYADISLKREAPGHSAKIIAENVDFSTLSKLYFNYNTSQGLLSGTYDFTGRGDDIRTMRGHGEVSVVNGNVFAIPVLGPFSGILNGIVPGMGYNIAHQATATFEARDGVIETRDFLVKGQGFEMLGGGKLFFPDDKIEFNIRINAQGLPGVILFPVSKLFEYVSDGSLSKPSWRPARLPSM